MVRAWYMDNDSSDQRLEHHRNPPQFLTITELYEASGVEYFKVKPTIDLENKCERNDKVRMRFQLSLRVITKTEEALNIVEVAKREI